MKKYIYIALIILGAISLHSCNLDINKDPNFPTELKPEALLSGAEYHTGMLFSEGYYLNSQMASFTHHTVSKEVNNYSLPPEYSTLGNTWSQAFAYVVSNNDGLIKLAASNDDYIIFGAIGKTLKALLGMFATDLWGDVPFSESNKEVIQPKVDKSSDVYNDVFALLNEAKADFVAADAKAINPGGFDYFYEGDVDKWITAVNTIQFKLLVQSRKAKSLISYDGKTWEQLLSALTTENNLMKNGGDLEFLHTATVAPDDERKSGFLDEYLGSSKSTWISPWFFEIMSGFNSYNVTNNPFDGITDPRIPYYYVNQLLEGGVAQNDTDYRYKGFISILFASNSDQVSSNQNSSMTTVGIYPVGGKYDDGNGGEITSSSGTGVAPDRMVQAYSVPFMMAELALAGDITGGASAAKTHLEDGIKASFYHVDKVSQAAKGAASVPKLSSSTEANDFITAVLLKYDAATSDDKKMEIVMTQKWIASFYNTYESYNDIRRTGYPLLFKGDSNGLGISPFAPNKTPSEVRTTVTLNSLRDFPRIMYYPYKEVSANSENISNEGRILSKYGHVFWDAE